MEAKIILFLVLWFKKNSERLWNKTMLKSNLPVTQSRMWLFVKVQQRSVACSARCKCSNYFYQQNNKNDNFTLSYFCQTERCNSFIQSVRVLKGVTRTNWISTQPHLLYMPQHCLITAFFFHAVSLTRIAQEVSHSVGGWLDWSCDTVQESWRKHKGWGGGVEESSVTEIFTTSTRGNTWATAAVRMVCLRGNVAQCFEHTR